MSELVTPEGNTLSSTKSVKAIHPFGSSILIENLKPEEILNTTLFVSEETETEGAPQAYVVELGPKLVDCGISVGDRVVVQGSFIPVANTSSNGRTRGIIELHNIKAVVEEE